MIRLEAVQYANGLEAIFGATRADNRQSVGATLYWAAAGCDAQPCTVAHTVRALRRVRGISEADA